MTETDECPRCKLREDLEHLLKNCWYTKNIWKTLSQLYKRTDARRQTYDPTNLEFAIGARVSPAKLKVHIEIIRRLIQKDRPNILPRNLINQALDYLIICDKEHWAYYKKLRDALAINTQ